MFKHLLGKGAVVGAGLLFLLLVGFSVESQSRPPRRGDERTVRGTVKRFTTAPKGEIDGLILDDDTVVHWPPHLEKRFTGIVEKGDRVEATGWKETNPEGVEQVEVRTLTNLRTKASRENDDAPPPPKGRPGKGKARASDETVRGTVKRFTTAPKGEIDGLILDDDTVVHWPPHLESRFAKIAKKGERVEAAGRMERNPEGVEQLEVRTLTNLGAKASGDKDDLPLPAVDRRLRALEEKIDRLAEEIKRLRREK